MAQPLQGIRVVELATGIAGSYAGKLLADYGADVVTVEPPTGAPTRHHGPFPGEEVDVEQSALFLHLNTNKRSVVAALDGDVVGALIAGADVVIQCEDGLDAGRLDALRPGIASVTVTSFGLTGPYAGRKGCEIVHFALGGPMSATGDPTREPVKMGGEIGQYECGTIAAVAALAALTVAESSGEPVHVDLSNIETQVASIDRRMTYLLYGVYRGENVPRFGGYSVGPLPSGCRPAADGHVQISTLVNWLPRMIEVVGDPELAGIYSDMSFVTDPDVPDRVDAAVVGWSVTRTRQDAMEQAQARGWPVTAVNRPVDLLGDAHFAQRDFFVDVEHPVAGTVTQPGAPIRMDDGWALHRPAPTLGQHTDELTSSPPRPRSPTEGGGQRRLPLDGIRVLDMTVVWAGPYATLLLGDLGADVIRVDNPWIFPSATRGVFPRPPKEIVAEIGGIFGGYPDADPGDRPWNRIALFNAHARNKRSVTLDLRKDMGRDTLLRLIDHCDVLVENNSVDLLDKLGLDWATLHAHNPRLIELRMPSVGLAGPYRDFLGFGVNFEALCGLSSLRGYRHADQSENEAVFHMDAASGSAGAFAVLAALRRRALTGTGELIELSQSENMLNHIGEYLIDASRTGTEHGPLGNRHPVRAPQGCYPCSGDDQWVVISVGTDEEWAGLRRAVGDDTWADDAVFADAAGRREHHDRLDELIAGWTSVMKASEVFERCQREGVPAAPVLHELETLTDPHLRARGMFRPNGSPETGTHDHPAHIWHWDGPEMAWGPLPVLGGDNEAVFKGLLGMSDAEYGALVDDGHISLDYLAPDGSSL